MSFPLSLPVVPLNELNQERNISNHLIIENIENKQYLIMYDNFNIKQETDIPIFL